jgi:hypothetical protein
MLPSNMLAFSGAKKKRKIDINKWMDEKKEPEILPLYY